MALIRPNATHRRARPAASRAPSLASVAIPVLTLLLMLAGPVPVLAQAGSQVGSPVGPLAAALDALEDRDFNTALSFAGRMGNPTARKIIQWARLKEGLGDFPAISGFLDANPDWPQTYALRRSAERALTGHESARQVLDWFDRHPPLTTEGKVARLRALQSAGRTSAIKAAARDAWIGGNFSTDEERAFRRDFGRYLTKDDHAARLSELLWDGQIAEAKRMVPLVDAGHARVAEARILLQSNAPGVDGAIARVPNAMTSDPGLIFDRLVWRRKRDLFERAVELLSHPSANKGRPDAWASERAYLGREALQNGQVTRAYGIFANHGQDGGIGFANGEWMAGWIMLRFLKQPARALPHFETMHAGVSYPQSLSRAAYWAGRAAEAAGQSDKAQQWYRKAALHAETFYGQLAVEALNERLADHLESRPAITSADRARFAADERVSVIKLMDQAGRADKALPFMLALNDDAATPGFRVLAADFIASTDRPDMAVYFARRAALAGTMLPQAGYPVPPAVLRSLQQAPTTGQRPEPALVLSLIRQESNFNTEAVSRAGARGLMQLMPRTAQRMAQHLGETSSGLRLISDPGHNTRLGTAYFASLLDDFRGSYVLSIAGYNAGPQRSVRWMQKNGDPRQMEVYEVIDWIEKIPFSETRNYVQRVLEGAQVYRHRLGGAPDGNTLSRDLLR